MLISSHQFDVWYANFAHVCTCTNCLWHGRCAALTSAAAIVCQTAPGSHGPYLPTEGCLHECERAARWCPIAQAGLEDPVLVAAEAQVAAVAKSAVVGQLVAEAQLAAAGGLAAAGAQAAMAVRDWLPAGKSAHSQYTVHR